MDVWPHARHGLCVLDQSVIALRNCRRLLRLVNQLLDIQRLDAGKMQASFQPCNIVEFTSQTIEAFRPYCDRKNIQLFSEFSECPEIYLDLEKFETGKQTINPELHNLIRTIENSIEPLQHLIKNKNMYLFL